ncbi:hypothetical protein [Streptomyces sp. NPDC088135]|uniref:ferredoxin n=1 Tax=Streptomyces sp. NPDC088135 TaxID=3160993 RepID=UPI00342F5C96
MGTGVCALTSPEVFDQDDDGKVTQLDPAPPAGSPPRRRSGGRPACVQWAPSPSSRTTTERDDARRVTGGAATWPRRPRTSDEWSTQP